MASRFSSTKTTMNSIAESSLVLYWFLSNVVLIFFFKMMKFRNGIADNLSNGLFFDHTNSILLLNCQKWWILLSRKKFLCGNNGAEKKMPKNRKCSKWQRKKCLIWTKEKFVNNNRKKNKNNPVANGNVLWSDIPWNKYCAHIYCMVVDPIPL